MILNDILERISVPNKQSIFTRPPKTSYLIWFDNINRRGADLKNCITEHAISFELYAYSPDNATEKEIESSLDLACVQWEKTDRQWIDSEKLYMTIYDFDFTEKEN